MVANASNVIALNDEAHHAWRVPAGSSVRGVAKEDVDVATKWIDGLDSDDDDDASVRTLTKQQWAELLRQQVDTVGQISRPRAQIQNVISVGMLTEGGHAKAVTHVLGLRAFSGQLLCEQVVGRGLRRTSYDINTGYTANFVNSRTPCNSSIDLRKCPDIRLNAAGNIVVRARAELRQHRTKSRSEILRSCKVSQFAHVSPVHQDHSNILRRIIVSPFFQGPELRIYGVTLKFW